MAQNEPLQQAARGAVDAYEIRRQDVQPQLEVFARPTDPFVNPGNQGQQLVNALSAIHPALNAYAQMQEAQKPQNAVQGAADAVNDQLNGMDMSKMNMDNTDGDAQANKPSGFLNLGAGYNEAYDQMNGKLHAANDFKPVAWQFYQDNQGLTPEEFAQKFKQEVMPGFVGTMNPHQLAGFLPEATAIEDSIAGANREQFMKSQETQKLATIAASNRIDLEASLQKVLGVTSMDQMLPGDPSGMYKKFLTNKDSNLTPGAVSQSDQLADTVYSFYRQALAQSKAVGLTTAQASANFLSTVTDMARRYGMPELLQYAYKQYKPTDEEAANGAKPDNVTVADAFGKQVEEGILHAKESQNKMQAALAKQESDALTKANDDFMQNARQKAFGLLIGNGATRQAGLVQLWTDINTNKDKYGVTDSQYAELNSVIEKGLKAGSFANADNSNVVSRLYAKTIHLTSADVQAAAPYITESRYVALMNKVDQYQLSAANDAKAEQHWAEHKGTEEALSSILKKYVVSGTLGQILNPGGKETQTNVQNQLGTWMSGQQHVTAQSLNDFYTKVVAPHNPVPPTLFGESATHELYPLGSSPSTPTASPVTTVRGGNKSPAPTQSNFAPKGLQARVGGKILTSDGQGGWH
jgi:hypothetical protein